MIVFWSDKAKARLREIHDHIETDSPLRAKQVVDRLTRRSEELASRPLADRSVPEYKHEGLREVLERPFRIIFLLGSDRVDIITIKHYRQRLPKKLMDL